MATTLFAGVPRVTVFVRPISLRARCTGGVHHPPAATRPWYTYAHGACTSSPRALPNGYRPQVRGGPARIDDHTGGSLAGKLSREASSTASGNSRRGRCATTPLEGESGGRPATSDRSWFVTTVSPCRPDARLHRASVRSGRDYFCKLRRADIRWRSASRNYSCRRGFVH